VQSELGSGTTFEVFLPRVDAPAPDGPTPLPPSPSPAHGGARVLLAEDEAAVRGVLERALSRAGYQVVVACNGDEAVQLAEERGPFELMITDTVMPGMSGWEVGKKLGARWPELRILYISGYSEDALAHGGVLEPGLRFLQKPFSPGDLLECVRRILDE
jgi:DNA-binding NtrC family response regulator